jgi:phage-related protein
VARKPLFWVGSSRDDIRAFPRNAKRHAGHQLDLVQSGLEPSDWRPMTSVGVGVKEIRIHTPLEHRVLYIAKFPEGVYVLHAFQKRSRTTPQREIRLAKHRLRGLLQGRREQAAAEKEEAE